MSLCRSATQDRTTDHKQAARWTRPSKDPPAIPLKSPSYQYGPACGLALRRCPVFPPSRRSPAFARVRPRSPAFDPVRHAFDTRSSLPLALVACCVLRVACCVLRVVQSRMIGRNGEVALSLLLVLAYYRLIYFMCGSPPTLLCILV